MHSMLLVAVLAGLGGMLGWGFGDFFAKTSVDNLGPIRSLVWAHACGSAVFVLAAGAQVFVVRQAVPLPVGSEWLGLAGFGVLQMIVYWLAYKGFEKGQLAVLNPVFASFAGIVALVAILFFGEPAGILTVLALALLLFGILLINSDLETLKSRKLKVLPGLKEIGAATILAAFWTLGWDKFVGGHNPLSYALWMYIFMTLAAVALAKLLREKIRGVPARYRKFLFLTGLGEAVAYLAISWGYSSTNLTAVVALISGAFSVPTVILAYLFLKERITRIQLAAVGIIVAAIAILSLS